MSFLNKRVEESMKQAKLLVQMNEISYRALNGTRQTRSNFINNDFKEQAHTDQKRLSILTGLSKKTTEEMEEMNELTTKLPELKNHLVVLTKQINDMAAEHGKIFAEGKTVVAEKTVIDDEIKDMINFDVPLLEKKFDASKKKIETYQDNIK